ncbi:heterokaryon incompatibility protein-domain-containing protein, partial [Echria macrotheca]
MASSGVAMSSPSTRCKVVRGLLELDYMEPFGGIIDCHRRGCVDCRFLVDVLGTMHLPIPAMNEQLMLEYTEVEHRYFTIYIEKLDLDAGQVDIYTGEVSEEPRPVSPMSVFSTGHSFSLHHSSQDNLAWLKGLKTLSTPPPLFDHDIMEVAKSSASTAAFDRARQWLSHCVENHPHCRTHNREGAGPGRLLELSSDSPNTIRLVDFESRTEWPPYACLSYCWGTDLKGVITTTNASLADHLVGISVEVLPKTLADAVRVCRELGVPYLWVDSLCIIQQDSDDFAKEGSKMDAIYANSLLTMYAKHVSSCKDGFLGPQDFGKPDWQSLAPFPTPTGLPFYVRQGNHKVDEDFPLDSRGWCLQECMLPKRQLIYTGKEMVWKCNSHHLCECGHIFPGPGDGGCGYTAHSLRAADARFGDEVQWWTRVVENYSDRSLTNLHDKLPAISAVARLATSHLFPPGVGYFAGLLEEGLPDQLLWWRENWLKQRARVDDRMPTWSWASVPGPVKFSHPDKIDQSTPIAVVNSISCTPSHPGYPLGSITSGYLVLNAPVLEVHLAV